MRGPAGQIPPSGKEGELLSSADRQVALIFLAQPIALAQKAGFLKGGVIIW
jgi:hypothetical protein